MANDGFDIRNSGIRTSNANSAAIAQVATAARTAATEGVTAIKSLFTSSHEEAKTPSSSLFAAIAEPVTQGKCACCQCA